MQSTTIEPLGQIIAAPPLTLVTIDGFGVPDCERWSPVCSPKPASSPAV